MASSSQRSDSSASASTAPPFVNTYMATFSEQEIKEWDARSDVLYHFYAYRHFNMNFKDSCIDLVNLDDADVQFYNRTSMMIRGLSASHEAATYLNNFALKYPVNGADTYRKQFICHIREYNMLSATRRRFYMLGLSEEEVDHLKNLPAIPPEVAAGSVGGSVNGYSGKENILKNFKLAAKNGEIETIGNGELRGAAFMDTSKYLSNDPSPQLNGPVKKSAIPTKNLSWATDGCSVNPISASEAAHQEVEMKNLIKESLMEREEKLARGSTF